MFNIQFITGYNNSALENLFNFNLKNKKIKVLKNSYKQFHKQLLSSVDIKKKQIRYVEIEPQSISKVFLEKKIFNRNHINLIKKEILTLINLIIESNINYDLSIISLFKNFRNNKELNNTDYKINIGRKSIELELNLLLIKKLSKFKNIILINPTDFIFSKNSFETEKYWFNTKSPYSLNETKILVDNIYKVINDFYSYRKKLIICDLDNTLWGGLIGDDGVEDILLGGHNPKGEAYLELQRLLLDLKNNGIVLAICSKNNEKIALTAINKHPEMVLRKKDFVSIKINWNDKASNIKDILDELNLNQEDAIFLDDSESERARVRSVFTKMLIPELPENNIFYPKILRDINCFNLEITNEDKKRTSMYKQNNLREESKKTFIKNNSYLNWLTTLNLELVIKKLNKIDLNRAIQLINKTNQMNLATKRYTVKEMNSLWMNKNNHLFTFRVKDKFGDYGLTGIMIFSKNNSQLHINDFILSCRVFGKYIEHSMLEFANYYCIKNNIKELSCKYIKTKKNKPCLDFLNTTNYFSRKNNSFTWQVNKKLNFPKFIKIFYKDKIINYNK